MKKQLIFKMKEIVKKEDKLKAPNDKDDFSIYPYGESILRNKLE